ncbi:hypothetical protein YK56LOC_50450 [Caballeronia sp. HLA56]
MTGVGEQRGGMREKAVDGLHDHDQHVQADCQRERAPLSGLRRVMVMMSSRAVVVTFVVVTFVVVTFVVVTFVVVTGVVVAGMLVTGVVMSRVNVVFVVVLRLLVHRGARDSFDQSISVASCGCGSAMCSSNSPSIPLIWRSAAT